VVHEQDEVELHLGGDRGPLHRAEQPHRAPSALAPTLAGSGIIALIAIVELRLGERHLLQQSYAT
jgi:hypothetical protein